MNLFSAKTRKRFAEIGNQNNEKDPIAIAKLISPTSLATWYVISLNIVDKTCYCYVTGLGNDAFSFLSIEEIKKIRVPPYNLPLEVDKQFEECRISEVKTGKVL